MHDAVGRAGVGAGEDLLAAFVDVFDQLPGVAKLAGLALHIADPHAASQLDLSLHASGVDAVRAHDVVVPDIDVRNEPIPACDQASFDQRRLVWQPEKHGASLQRINRLSEDSVNGYALRHVISTSHGPALCTSTRHLPNTRRH